MKSKHLLSVCMAAIVAATGTVGFAGSSLKEPFTVNAVDDRNDDWLHAKGSRLYDSAGNEVWLTGANWFGFNCSERCAHYLWSADCDDLLREVADRGINIIRFPFSSELLIEWMNGELEPVSGGGLQAAYNPPTDQLGEDGTVTKAGTYGCINHDFVEADGKTHVDSKKAFDIILGKLKHYGIKCFIDVHSPHADNSGHVWNTWYGKAGVTTESWIKSLVWVANEYKNDDTLLGFDLENEPHGKGPEGDAAAKWDGSTDENNWAYAATKCANAILKVNPNALILIEGVEQSMSGAQAGDYWGMADRKDNSPYIGAWWGGNLRGVKQWPIKPDSGTSQIVYSPHDYGPSVYEQTWFDKDFNEQTLLDDYWRDTWAYINEDEIAPLLIGEWGGHMEGKNLKWMTLLRDYMIKHHINHTFWCLNTNSGDTGGLWKSFSYSIGNVTDKSNGTTIIWEEDKYELLEKALWQTESGKYIGLDHQRPLGINGTGISLNEFYGTVQNSNLDGGKSNKGGTVITVEKTEPTTEPTTAPTTEPTTAPTTTATTVTTPSGTTKPESTTEPTTTAARQTKWGDANLDGTVDVSDAVILSRFAAEDPTAKIEAQGKINSDVTGDGKYNSEDVTKILKFIAKFITEAELAPNK